MEKPTKAVALILANIDMFDEARRLFDNADEEIIKVLYKNIESWAVSNGWNSEFNDTALISPPDWVAEENEYYAYFYWGEREDTDSYWLAGLCGAGQTEVGLRFEVNHKIFGGKSKWNSQCKSLPDLNQLSKIGFISEGKGTWFLPVSFDKGCIAEAYENNDLEEGFRAIAQSLDIIKESILFFNEIVEFGKKASL